MLQKIHTGSICKRLSRGWSGVIQCLRIMIFNHRLRRGAGVARSSRASGLGKRPPLWGWQLVCHGGPRLRRATTHDEPQHPHTFSQSMRKTQKSCCVSPGGWQPGVFSRHPSALKARSCMPHSSPAPTARRNSSPGRSAEGAPAPGGAGGFSAKRCVRPPLPAGTHPASAARSRPTNISR